jgi:hypothetical protein
MFRAFFRASSGAQWLQSARTQHDWNHDTKVKSEAATAVIELMMMGGKTSETCWVVNKRRDNKLENCCIWLMVYLKRCNNVSKFYYSIFIWSVTCSGDTPPIIRSLKLHWQPLVFHTWKVVGCVVGGQRPPTTPSTYEKPEAASAVLGSWWWSVCRPKQVKLQINME